MTTPRQLHPYVRWGIYALFVIVTLAILFFAPLH